MNQLVGIYTRLSSLVEQFICGQAAKKVAARVNTTQPKNERFFPVWRRSTCSKDVGNSMRLEEPRHWGWTDMRVSLLETICTILLAGMWPRRLLS